MSTTATKDLFFERINENKGIIFKISRSYCREQSDREDLAQEIIYNLWKAFPRFDGSVKFSTWMYRVSLNVAISSYRKEERSLRATILDESMIVFEEINVDPPDNSMELLFTFISQLKEIDRSIILLYLDDKPHKEIADVTGVSISNVATRIGRIKDSLRNSFSTIQDKNHGTRSI